MDFGVRITIDSRGMDALDAELRRAAGGGQPSGHMRDLYVKWGAETQTFNVRRFRLLSRGGGEWPPLAASTIKARMGPNKSAKRRGAAYGGGRSVVGDGGLGRGASSSLGRGVTKAKREVRRRVAILIDTTMLEKALFQGSPGNTMRYSASGILYGVDEPVPHPSGGKRAVTVADIAAWHHTGAGRLPVRRVVDVPDEPTLNRLAGYTVTAIQRIIASAGGAGGTV